MQFVKGAVRKISTYKDKVDSVEIWVNKNKADSLEYIDGERVPVDLVVASKIYNAGLRATRRNKYVWICPDLKDEKGNRVRLVDALEEVGIGKNAILFLEPVHSQESNRKDKIVIHFSSSDPIEDIERHRSEFETLTETERQAVIKSRVGQGAFREGLVQIWGSCSVTGVKDCSLLRASHIKPWRICSNQERLDYHNGLLLIPNLDHLFDAGCITFNGKGEIKISKRLTKEDCGILNVNATMRLRKISEKNKFYLIYHRKNVFYG